MRISITKKDEKYLEIDTLPQDVKRHVVKEAIKNYMQTDEYREILKTFGNPNNITQNRVVKDKRKVEKSIDTVVHEKSSDAKDVDMAIDTEVALEIKPATVIAEKTIAEETHIAQERSAEDSDNTTQDTDTLMVYF